MSLKQIACSQSQSKCHFFSHGERVVGVLHLPVGVQTPPVVIIMHGYASGKEGTNGIYQKLASRLTHEGIAVLRFDFRGYGESEGCLSRLTFEDLIEDAKQMIRYATKLHKVDSSRIGVYGSSMGGALAVFGARAMPRIKSLVLWAPVASGRLWIKDFILKNPLSIFRRKTAEKVATRGIRLNREFQRQFRKMRAFMHLSELRGVDVLHIHGNKDRTLSLSHQKAYRVASKMREEKTEFLIFRDVGHSIQTEEDTERLIERVAMWFKESL